MRKIYSGVLIGLATACQTQVPERLTVEHAEAIRDSVEQMMASIARDLHGDGPIGWLQYFEPTPQFFMASDGRVAFPTNDSAETFVRGFAPSISEFELEWSGIRVEPLARGLALVGASYSEVLTDTSGSVTRWNGYFTGIAAHGALSWQLRNLHWSAVPQQP